MLVKLNLQPPVMKDYNDKNDKFKVEKKLGGACSRSKLGNVERNAEVDIDGNKIWDDSSSAFSPSEVLLLNPKCYATVAASRKNITKDAAVEMRSSNVCHDSSSLHSASELELNFESAAALSASKIKCKTWLETQQQSVLGLSSTVMTPPKIKRPLLVPYTPSSPSTTDKSLPLSNKENIPSPAKERCGPLETLDQNINVSPKTNVECLSTQQDTCSEDGKSCRLVSESEAPMVQGNRKPLAKEAISENLYPTSDEHVVPTKKKKTLGYTRKREPDQVKSPRLRKAVQLQKIDTSGNESEESESGWDFHGSDSDDPTWKVGSTKSSESDQETGSDISCHSPLRSVSNSPTRSEVNKSSTGLEDNNSPTRSNSSAHSHVNNSPVLPEIDNSALSSARRKGSTQLEKAKERQLKRNSGCAYTTSSNKVIHARSMKALPEKCRLKCSSKLNEDDRKIVFSEYWGQKDFNRRVSYIIGHVFEKPTKFPRKTMENSQRQRTCTLKYELDIHNSRIEVCKKCFLATLGENDSFVKRALLNKKKSVSGVMKPDARGRKPSVRKTPELTTEAIIKHINDYPRYSSHYGRSHSSRMYLGTGMTIQGMINDYCDKGNPKTSLSVYTREFRKTGLKFKPPKVDTCNKCDAFEMLLKSSPITEQAEIIADRDAHHEKARLAYDCKKQDKADQTSENWVASFDLQQVLYCPQLSCGINHMWTEIEAGRGANEIASCISHFIACDVPPGVKKLTLWSDTCSGQNKNSIVCAALVSAVAQHPSLAVIDHKFLVPGHTHMECDQVHAEIEKKKKRASVELHHPANFYNFVKTVEYRKETLDVVCMKNHFLNVSSLLNSKSQGPLVVRGKNQAGEPFFFAPVQWFRYQKKNPTVVLYKHCHAVDVPFSELSFRRKGKLSQNSLKPSECSSRPRPISIEKKKDLIDLLPPVNPLYHHFYQNLVTSADEIDVDPDCLPTDDVTDEIQKLVEEV
ncbi:Phosphate import ATP-binding protein PstB 2 [Frankliniella fusca]|uniref:Phosphate import ATP-binding protein PstB 2 n=1 Tax=Frankliniella fusca TaxID=407009 RepID=A0AAE1I093_9NEOP|nr:Phosphate import ATP-binding protein PstB 2 [Frankliniella fusca]